MKRKPKPPLPAFDVKPTRTVAILSFKKPKPKQAPNYGAGKKVFTPADVRMAEEELRTKVKEEMERLSIKQPYLGAVALKAVWYLTAPDWVAQAWDRGDTDIGAFQVPDSGNLLKLVEDACKGVDGLYLDDCQVVTHVLHKCYSPWHGFCLWFTLSDPVHPLQLERRVRAYKAALDRVEERRLKRNKAKAEKAELQRQAELQRERLARDYEWDAEPVDNSLISS